MSRKADLKSVFLWIVPPVVSLGFLFLFYKFSGGTGHDSRLLSIKDFPWVNEGLPGIITVIKLAVITGLTGIAGFIPFIPFFIWEKFRRKDDSISFFNNPVTHFILAFIFSGLVCFSLLHPISDSPQFWSIAVSLGTSFLLFWIFAKLFNSTGNIPLKIYSLITIAFLFWQNKFVTFEWEGEKKEFLENVLELNNNPRLKFAVLWLPHGKGMLSKDQNNYFPMIVLTSQVKEFRPVSLTMRETIRDSNPYFDGPIQKFIANSEINRYVESQKEKNVFISESESKLSFLREFQIPFVMVAPDYHPDSILAPHFVTKLVSPDGWKFCAYVD